MSLLQLPYYKCRRCHDTKIVHWMKPVKDLGNNVHQCETGTKPCPDCVTNMGICIECNIAYSPEKFHDPCKRCITHCTCFDIACCDWCDNSFSLNAMCDECKRCKKCCRWKGECKDDGLSCPWCYNDVEELCEKCGHCGRCCNFMDKCKPDQKDSVRENLWRDLDAPPELDISDEELAKFEENEAPHIEEEE